MLLLFAFVLGPLVTVNPATAASAEAIDRDAQKALGALYAKSPSAKTLGEKALGILVFPGIVKGASSSADNMASALIKDGKAVAYYNTVGPPMDCWLVFRNLATLYFL
jgi:hypothetical protein